MKKILYTTTAFVLCGGIVQANAACIATPSCTTLGYVSTTSCTDGLKCPFGNYWYCPSNSGGACSDFPYLCLGRGYLDGGGIGADCDGKYAKCTCYDGFEWQDGKGCVEITDCRIGSTLFSDKSCSMSDIDIVSGAKTPIGVVVYSDGKGHGQALALRSIGRYQWSTSAWYISTLPLYVQELDAARDFSSCENSKKLKERGNKNELPAVWVANEYSTEGTKSGDWCLPAAGIMTSIFNNKTIITTGLSRSSGVGISRFWSSSRYSEYYIWTMDIDKNYGILKLSMSNSQNVRPVLEF